MGKTVDFMGDHENGQVMLFVQLGDKFHNYFLCKNVNPRYGLVKEQYIRLRGKRARDKDALFLAASQLRKQLPLLL